MHALTDSPANFGRLGEKSSPKCGNPCLGRWRSVVPKLMLLALSSAEKSVTVQTHTKKVNDISSCVDNKQHYIWQTWSTMPVSVRLMNTLLSRFWNLFTCPSNYTSTQTHTPITSSVTLCSSYNYGCNLFTAIATLAKFANLTHHSNLPLWPSGQRTNATK